MYTIISGTNRIGSHTLKVAKEYQQILTGKGIDAGLLTLEGINLLARDAAFEAIEQEIILPTKNFIIISPEYNGSFPGALKLLFDTSRNHYIWQNKTALLTGVSSGRAGNLRGMDHLTGVLNYLKITVHPNKLPISIIDKLLDKDGKLNDENTFDAINKQLDEFIEWINN
ncbi:MAG: NADPH-dependent FMN reductase [Ferruginibacter sp.]